MEMRRAKDRLQETTTCQRSGSSTNYEKKTDELVY